MLLLIKKHILIQQSLLSNSFAQKNSFEKLSSITSPLDPRYFIKISLIFRTFVDKKNKIHVSKEFY